MATPRAGSIEAATRTLLPQGFHALSFGNPSAPPLLWLHGFPDHPPTAVDVLERLGRTHRVVAPWLRGYAPSPLAGELDLQSLANDVLAMIEAIGGPVDLVGHDWGAAIVYAVCALRPDRVRRAATLALPHPLSFLHSLRSPAQLRRSWYMGLFQLPNAERFVRANDLALIDRLWRAWSPGYALPDERRRELHACLAASLPAPLGYYRAMVRPLRDLRTRTRRLAAPIATPLLQLHGADDGCVLPPHGASAAFDARRFTARTLEIIPNTGHFLHLEQPDTVGARLAGWLT
ncbi:MAG: alpha/beta hydrolase [Deltaproteobacteria bacterium]|nr:alpha/beta hydrolase [Deltaproteobacteria bacterium]